MLLVGMDGSELDLSIVGYRFPLSERDPWDSNWLLVSLRVVAPEGTWEVVDPCLTTWEADHLIRWLTAAALAAPGFGPRPLNEPNLSFAARHGGDGVTLRARFELERRPPWAQAAGAGGLAVELVVDRTQLAAAAAALAEDLARFPQRGDDPTV
jgi:hypothetical protein